MTAGDWMAMSGFCVVAAVTFAFIGWTGARPWWLPYLAAVAYSTAAVVFALLALATVF